ncbi:Gamma-glutamylcyclotransferase [Fasciola gigantica]|uniref:glutathione-specific gamma-glutamylcyclotransferase n=1 Tax=Fasciola gigantica TaxID=46835 RepID=A0A504Z5K2_FASGI|nr:Gamma-glutamylcyclotransferase [Fasciola gigantica]
MEPLKAMTDQNRLRVFGYGSLIWKPSFQYNKRTVGYIKGYLVRFYQGNINQRGSPGRPGRVATLIPAPSPEARVWGCVYEVLGEKNVHQTLDRLIEREVVSGGYKFDRVQFYPVQSSVTSSSSTESVKNWIPLEETKINIVQEEPYEVLFHLTDPEFELYLGDAAIEKQADQIATAFGISGANSEYVLLMAAFLRTEVPKEALMNGLDPYLFELEALVRQRLTQSTQAVLLPAHGTNVSSSRESLTQHQIKVHERRRASAREFATNNLLGNASR